MTNSYLQYFKPKVLIGLIVLITIIVFIANQHLSISISIFGVVTFILILISTKLWNKKLVKWMFWVDDFSGSYEGILSYQYIDNGEIKKGELKHVKVINQNGYRISVTSFTYKKDGTPSSQSENVGMFVKNTGDQKHFQLIYNYKNDGSTEQNFHPYWGTEVIKIIDNKDNKVLSGYYFTNRIPQTKGNFINMKWISNELNHKF